MAARSGNGWTDVNLADRVVGFVTGPDKDGKYHAYLDNSGTAGSTRVGSASNKTAAVGLVQDASKRRK